MAPLPTPAATRCLITGGAGNLGCQLAQALAGSFEKLILLDIAKKPIAWIPSNAIYERVDICDFPMLKALFDLYRPAAVVHLASLLSGSSERDARAAWRINTTATLEILELAAAHPGLRLIFASSLATFGNRIPGRLTDDQPQWPSTLYGVTKVACERLGSYYREAGGLDFRCLRLPITLSRFAPRGAVSATVSQAFIASAREGRFIFPARPETEVAGLYVKDVVKSLSLLLAAPRESLNRAVYNIAGFKANLADVSEAILKRLPHCVHSFVPDPAVETVLTGWPCEIDDGNARRDWGWSPSFDLGAAASDFLSDLSNEPYETS